MAQKEMRSKLSFPSSPNQAELPVEQQAGQTRIKGQTKNKDLSPIVACLGRMMGHAGQLLIAVSAERGKPSA